MKYHGTLIKWNDDRGFGFISLSGNHEEVFVHISEFPRGDRPHIGETISFEIETSSGKKRAIHVIRPDKKPPHFNQPNNKESFIRSYMAVVIPVLILASIGFLGYKFLSSAYWLTHPVESARKENESQLAITPQISFKCDGRQHCSQMKSCAEAVYFIDHCPNTKMDGDGDGRPCEDQLCK